MAFDVQTLTDAARCAECLSPNQKQNVLLYLLNGILENGAGGGGSALHNLLSLTHPDTVPGPPLRGSLIVGNTTPEWEALLIGAANRVLRSDGVDATWSQLVLTTDVTGILPIANGGTNSSAALNNNRIMVSSGGAIVEAAALTDGQLLIGSTGAAPVVASLTAGANITITPGAGSISIAATGVVTQAYSTIQEEGAAVTQRSILNFISPALTAADDAGNVRTNVTLTHSALTGVDDTNVTLTLGGSPTTALLAATSLTLGWTGVLSPARGGTGTSTVFTTGSVIFAGAAGVFTEDNTNFFWDDTNNRLGIGTTTPAAYLELSSNLFPSNNALVITLSNDTGTNFPNIFYRRSRGTVALPTAVMANDRLGGFGFRGYGATGYFTADNAVFRAFAAENFTNTTMGTYFTLESTPIGSTTRLERLRIDTFSISMPPTGTAVGNTNELRFLELAASGTNYTGFKAPDAIAASEIYVLPDAAPSANRFLRAGAVAAGVSTLSWAQISLTADVTGILPVANGGTGTSTAFTLGSVIFAGAAGVFSQDNANFFWDDTNNRLGLGTASPNQQLELTGNLRIPATTSTAGIIFQGANRFIHTFGTQNVFVGINAGNLTNTGTANVGIGQESLSALTSGIGNMAVGFRALNANTSGSNNLAIGQSSLLVNTTGSDSIAMGAAALQANTTGTMNTAIGASALFANTTGNNNTGIGVNAGRENQTGSDNTCIGSYAGAGVATNSNAANTFIGTLSGNAITTGGSNACLGYGTGSLLTTGSNNICIGVNAGNNLTTGAKNIVIGYNIDSPTATNNNTLNIGNLIFSENINQSAIALSDGGIGIGVITPLAKFHVTNSAAATVAVIIKAAAAQSANQTEWQDPSAVILTKVNSAGNVGVRMAATALTAYLHIAAGTTAASTAPIKLTTGTSMTAAEAGAVEFTTDDLFFTITTGAARKRLLMADATAGLTSGKIPIATTNGRLIDLTASAAYTPTNVTTDRSYDANATTLDELSDIVGSIIADLQTKGILG